jgi:PST family polysaccharide transporter
MPAGEIRARAVRGVASSFSALLINQVCRFGLGVFLARKLVPDDFGLIAIVMAVTTTFDIFRDQGLTLALIQARNVDEENLHSAFWWMTGLTILEVGLLLAAAPAVALFYHRPELGPLTLALSAGSAISGMASIPLALLKRNMHFDRLAKIQIASLLLAIPFIASAAVAGWGYWALAVYMVLPPFLSLLGAWKQCSWRPRLTFSWQALSPLTVHGRRFFFVDLLTYWSQMADALLLGRVLPVSLIGLYQRAQSTRLLATSLIDSTLGPVSLSGLARLQDRPEAFWKAYRTSVYAMALVLAPVFLLLALAPGECLGFVFGSQWIPAAPAMRTTAFLFLLHPLIRTTHGGLLALGRPDLLLRWLLTATLLLVAGLLLGRRWGLQGVALGMVAAQTLALPMGLFALAGQGKTTIAALIKPILPVGGAALALALLIFPFSRLAGPETLAAWPRLGVALVSAALLSLFLFHHLLHSTPGKLVLLTLQPGLPVRLQFWLKKALE